MSEISQLIIILLAFVGLTAFAEEIPPGASINGVSMSGTGCDTATAAVTISPDLKDLSILFDNMLLETKPEMVNPRNLTAMKSCSVLVDMGIPAGWQFALVSVDYRGFAGIPANATGFQRFLYSAPMMQIVSMREARFVGPVNDNYTFQAQQKPTRLSWTPCSTSNIKLSMTAQIGVMYAQRNNYPQAMVSLDSQDLSFKQSFQVKWQRCTK